MALRAFLRARVTLVLSPGLTGVVPWVGPVTGACASLREVARRESGCPARQAWRRRHSVFRRDPRRKSRCHVERSRRYSRLPPDLCCWQERHWRCEPCFAPVDSLVAFPCSLAAIAALPRRGSGRSARPRWRSVRRSRAILADRGPAARSLTRSDAAAASRAGGAGGRGPATPKHGVLTRDFPGAIRRAKRRECPATYAC